MTGSNLAPVSACQHGLIPRIAMLPLEQPPGARAGALPHGLHACLQEVTLDSGVTHELERWQGVTPFWTAAVRAAQELRVKGSYLHHKEIKAAQGVKIAAQGLESAVAGTQMYVVGPNDDAELLKEEVMADMQDIFSSVDRGGAC